MRYVYDGDHLSLVTEAAGHVLHVYTYYPGIDQPHSVLTNGRVSYYQQDGAGNVTGLLDDHGGLEVQYAYTPFGEVSTVTGWKSHHLYVKGREYDGHAGLTYMRNRWYDPELRRFISEDPLGVAGGINPYVFAGNDPINYSDPFGLCTADEATRITYTRNDDGDWVETRICSGGSFATTIWGRGDPLQQFINGVAGRTRGLESFVNGIGEVTGVNGLGRGADALLRGDFIGGGVELAFALPVGGGRAHVSSPRPPGLR